MNSCECFTGKLERQEVLPVHCLSYSGWMPLTVLIIYDLMKMLRTECLNALSEWWLFVCSMSTLDAKVVAFKSRVMLQLILCHINIHVCHVYCYIDDGIDVCVWDGVLGGNTMYGLLWTCGPYVLAAFQCGAMNWIYISKWELKKAVHSTWVSK